MKIDVLNIDGKKVSSVDVNIEGTVNKDLVYETVKMQLAGRRSGTASTKTRSNVRGGGKKPWKQKGTGRARSGSTRSPVWRHGGVAFGPHPRDYSYGMPKKARKEALKSAILYRLNEGKFMVFDSFELKEPKTKLALKVMENAKIENALIVTDGEDRFLKLATRNCKDFKLLNVNALNVYDVLRYKSLVVTKAALEKIEALTP